MVEKFLIKSIAYIIAYAVYFKRQTIYYWKYVTTGQLTESIAIWVRSQHKYGIPDLADDKIPSMPLVKPPPPAMPPVITSRQLEDFDYQIESGAVKGNHVTRLSDNGIAAKSFREIAKTSEWKKQKPQTLKVRSGEHAIIEYHCKHCKEWVKIHEWGTKQNKKSVGYKCKCGKTTYVYD